ncbi:MAG: hypothetical protein N4A65_04380 [Cohaesibacter sp.]|jgi:hypothetical protein|nr:hypothetical protein [Cohaesibacter sp.]
MKGDRQSQKQHNKNEVQNKTHNHFLAEMTQGRFDFSHAHEIAPNSHDHYHTHDHVDGASNHHHEDKAHGESDGSLHCGAPILMLVSQQATLSIGGKARMKGNLVADLIPSVLPPASPPHRLA